MSAGSTVVTSAGSTVVTSAGSTVVTSAGSTVVTSAGSTVIDNWECEHSDGHYLSVVTHYLHSASCGS